MNYEEKIQELSERIEKLEKAEKKRIISKRIEIITKIVITAIILIILYVTYNYINNNYIKPYKEKIDNVNDKVESAENIINDKLTDFSKYFN